MSERKLLAAGIVAGLALGSGTAYSQGGFAPPELATTQVRDNIYMIRSGASGNVTVIVGDNDVLLIDDKFAMDHDGIMEQLRKITDKPIRYVINTHMHGDHSGGNAAMQALNADVIAHANARYIMAETQTEGLPNITIDDHLRIYFAGQPLDLYYFGRGHTDGDIVIHLPEERLVVMGDLFAIWGPHRHLVHYGAGGSVREWSRTLERALELDFDTVIPGHSGVTDRAMMEDFLRFTVRMGETVREMNRARKTRDEIRAVLEREFGWSGFVTTLGLDGIIAEMQ
jgi:glyoxylase-like metal-dependent hydrolase (beta-lactamase superfamily II)